MRSPLVVADVGNTALKVVTFDADGGVQCAERSRFSDPLFTIPVALQDAADAVLVSVSVSGLDRVEQACGRHWPVAGRDFPIPVENRTSRPEQAGDDRLCAALAATRRSGGAAVTVGCGTAITVDAVSSDGAFLGGAIAPGLRASLDGLHRAAPLLPAVVPEEEPASFPAGATAEAMRAAARLGFAGLIDRLVAEARRAVGKEAPVLLFGGDAPLLARSLLSEGVTAAPHLVCEGARAARLEG